MSNKSSPYGGFICEGTVIHGTLRDQDLLRSLAAELKRVLPFNSYNTVSEALSCADECDNDPDGKFAQCAGEIIGDLFDELDAIAAREGLTFGAHPGDGSDFGYWSPEE